MREFTIEEENLLCFFKKDSKEATIQNIKVTIPFMEEDMQQIAYTTLDKLDNMNEIEFSKLELYPIEE
ncbi:MAG: transposon-transfer assisting family protein [Clostridia bacterium]|nr:transposon-transfer assisting family protein [Clostridia bacterium]